MKSGIIPDKLAWIDMEFTGLDAEKCYVLSFAILITDQKLNIIAELPDVYIHQSEERLSTVDNHEYTKNPNVRKFLTESGVIPNVQKSTINEAQAQDIAIEFLSKHLKQGTSPLCGNSIYMDRGFLIKHLPRLNDYFHYRNIDVSTLKELYKVFTNTDWEYPKKYTHSALEDIKETIEELKYFKEHFLKLD